MVHLFRNNIIAISIAMTLIYMLVFFALNMGSDSHRLLTLFIFNDPALIGLLFMGTAIIMERNQGILPAILVSPLSLHTFLVSRIFVLSLLGTLCALGMAIVAIGFNFNVVQFSIASFLVTALGCTIATFLASLTNEFLKYMLLLVPFLIFGIAPPLLDYMGLIESNLFRIFPAWGELFLIGNSYGNAIIKQSDILLAYISSIVWIIALYVLSYRRFKKNVNE